MRRRNVLLLALLLSLPAAAGAQDPTDVFIKAEMQRQRIPGLSLVVIKDGAIVKAAGYGVADRRLKTPATPETVYKIGSVSKQFIATGIMLLVQDERLSLDDPISKYLNDTPATWSRITIRHLLTHTSGIVREAPAFDPRKIQSDADVITSAYSLPLRFEPGEKWEYGNTAYFALAEVIRILTGQPWTDALNGHRRVHHGGGIPGFQSEFARFLDDRLTVAILINLDDADVELIADGVAALYFSGTRP
jgi:CubicO group peptidase (beta-lactamase class C family)